MKKIPNLFHYATSELSQDAMICWLLAHANPEFEDADPRLQKLALTLINQFLEKSGYPPLSEPISKDHFKIKRQYRKVDVVARVNQYLFIIEDKTVAGIHGNQLQKYKLDFEKYCQEKCNQEKRYQGKEFVIVPIFFKTFDQSFYAKVKGEGFTPFLRDDLLSLLSQFSDIENDIFQDYYRHILSIERDVEAYRTMEIGKWKGRQWTGFFKALQQQLSQLGISADWKYTANKGGGQQVLWLSPAGELGEQQYLQLQSHAAREMELAIRTLEYQEKITTPLKRKMIHHLRAQFQQHQAEYPLIKNIQKVPRLSGRKKSKTSAIMLVNPKEDLFSNNEQNTISIEKIAQLIKEADLFLKRHCYRS